MAENSKIEWTDHTVNLWWGCSKVHIGCKNCYAEKLSKRYLNDVWGEDVERKRIKSAFNDLTKYQRQAKKENKFLRIFCGSMMDIFEPSKTLLNPSELPHTTTETGQLREELFGRINDGEFNNLIFLFLTKRPEDIFFHVPADWYFGKEGAPENVWYGTSISDQKTANDYVRRLSTYWRSNLFLSIEPQVGDITSLDLSEIDWVIQGGESGNKKRPFEIEWAESMKLLCERYRVPYFFKQIDKVKPIPNELLIRELPKLFKS